MAVPAPTLSTRPATTAAIATAFVAVTFIAFWPALGADFVSWDDGPNFVTNFHFRGLGPDQLRWMWTTTLLGHYVPLAWMTFGVDYVLWGMNPAGYHFTSILLHSVNALLLWRLLVALEVDGKRIDRQLMAAGAALFFAVHPLRVESVAWVTERRDVLSLLFVLITTLAYIRFVKMAKPLAYVAALVAFACALLSKASVVTLPAALLVLNWYPFRRLEGFRGLGTARVLRELAPFFMMSVVAGVASILIVPKPAQLPLLGKLVTSVHSLGFYLEKTLLPVRLSPLYEMPAKIDPFEGRFVISYLIVAVALAALWLGRRRALPAVTSVIVFAILVSPFLGVVQNGPQIAADRYTYFAGVALSGMFLAAIVALPNTATRLIASGSIIATLVVATRAQARVWTNSETLWQRVLLMDSTSAYANNNLGALRASSGRRSEAIAFFNTAIRLRPDLPAPYANLGKELGELGQSDSAVVLHRKAIAINPNWADAWNNLGVEQGRRGDAAGAIESFGQALRASPDHADAMSNLGVQLAQVGRSDEAIRLFREAIHLQPNHSDAHTNLGYELAQRGDLGAAVTEYHAALSADSTNVDARLNLGNALSMAGRPSEALRHYQIAAALRPNDPLILLNWGQALEMLGDRREAMSKYQAALQIDPQSSDLKAAVRRLSGHVP